MDAPLMSHAVPKFDLSKFARMSEKTKIRVPIIYSPTDGYYFAQPHGRLSFKDRNYKPVLCISIFLLCYF